MRTRGPGGSPRRLLTDWTTEAGIAGEGLLALVAGDDAVPEAVHLATLGYEVFVLDAVTSDADTPPRVHVVDVAPADVPGEWHGRFALVVADVADAGALPGALASCVAPAGLLLVLGHAPVPSPLVDAEVAGLAEVRTEVGPDPDARGDEGADRFRVVLARLDA